MGRKMLVDGAQPVTLAEALGAGEGFGVGHNL